MFWSKKTHEEGERKTETCFAWLPVELDEPKYCVVWLQRYQRDIEYRKHTPCKAHNWDNVPYVWMITKKYLNKERSK